MKSTAAKLSVPSPTGTTALVTLEPGLTAKAPTACGLARRATYTEVSNYTDGRMILDVVETRTNKLVFRDRNGGHRRTGKQRGKEFAL